MRLMAPCGRRHGGGLGTALVNVEFRMNLD
jgi:hypothetical protein